MKTLNCLLFFVALLFSCKTEAPDPKLLKYIEAASAQQMQLAIDSPEVNKAAEKFVEKIASDPEVLLAAQSLLTPLLQSPKLAAAGDSVLEEPKFLEAVQAMMKANPNTPPEQIGEIMEEHIDKLLAQKDFDDVFTSFIDQLIAKPEIAKQLTTIEQTLLQFDTSIPSKYDLLMTQKMMALNNGKLPTNEKETAQVIEKLMPPEKGIVFYTKIFESPVVEKALKQALLEILKDKQLALVIVQRLEAIVEVPALEKAAVGGLLSLTVEPPSAEKLRQAFQLLLDEPKIVAQLAEIFRELTKDNLLGIMRTSIQSIAKDPSYQEIFAETFLK